MLVLAAVQRGLIS